MHLRNNLSVKAEDETHLSALQDSPRAEAWFPGAHGVGRRSQSALGAPRQGPQEPYGRLTIALLNSTAVPDARLHGRAFRLTGPGAFEAVFREGRRSEGRHVQLVAAAAAQTPGRIGYVIGRKTLPRAVDRNRLRRRLREIVRAMRPTLAPYDVILRVKRVANRMELDAAVSEAAGLLAALVVRP